MERSTAMKTFDCNVTPKTPTLRDRDASFSSYLIPQKSITTTQFQPHQHHHQTNGSGLSRIALDDSNPEELSIFDAHKYFNEVTTNNDIQKVSSISSGNGRVSPTETERIIPRYSSASSSVDGYANIRNYRARSFHAATPTASSEASWNSQTGLLSHPPGAIPVSMKNPPNPNPTNLNNNNIKTSLSKPIWLLRRKCPCKGKKSVQVKEHKTSQQPKIQTQTQTHRENNPKTMNMNQTVLNNHHITVTPNNWVMGETPTTLAATKSQRLFPPQHVVTTLRAPPFNDGFTFPIPNGVVEEDRPRDSLEVFRSPDIEPKPLNFPFPAAKTAVEDDGDGASDASSDLFEIESFSTATQSTYPMMYRRSSRDSFEEGSTMTECYEPSEASIEWSVTTAEGYDESGAGNGGGTAVTAVEQWKKKGGKNNGLLVSCRCEKAVSVGPQPVKCGTDAAKTITTGTSWKHVSVNGNSNSSNSNNNNNNRVIGSVNKPPLARSHRNNTPRVSLTFAT